MLLIGRRQIRTVGTAIDSSQYQGGENGHSQIYTYVTVPDQQPVVVLL